MPDTEEAKKKEPMVDIDTSGPEVDVDISGDKKVEEVEQVGLDGVQRVELQPKEEALVAQGARAITPRSLDDASTR